LAFAEGAICAKFAPMGAWAVTSTSEIAILVPMRMGVNSLGS